MKGECVAPCGMNCNVCKRFLLSTCVGCIPRNRGCTRLCNDIRHQRVRFCYLCTDFPCDNLKRLDKRYRTRYNTSFIEHLESIRTNGVSLFLRNEEEKYRCAVCGGTICIHDGLCYTCKNQDKKIRINKK